MERHIWNAPSMSWQYGAKMLGRFWNGDKRRSDSHYKNVVFYSGFFILYKSIDIA